jgi:hypothetical protein
MLDENDVLVTQLRRVVAQNARNAAREGMIIGWWLRDFEVISHLDVCQCDMCNWQRGNPWWLM